MTAVIIIVIIISEHGFGISGAHRAGGFIDRVRG